MTPTSHVAASVVTTGIFYAVTHSMPGSIACFLSGIFIDIDHHFDLWIHKKKILLHPKDLFDYCEKEKEGKLYLIFHSYELLIIFGICLFVFHLGPVWWGLWVGMVVHLLLDQIFNPLKFGVYFLIYRIKNKFSKQSMFSREYFESMK